MLNLLQNIYDFILGGVNFIVTIIKSLIEAFMFIPSIYSSLAEAIGYLPPVLGLFAYVSVAFIILNYIIGRPS